jgi:hypothetical protein
MDTQADSAATALRMSLDPEAQRRAAERLTEAFVRGTADQRQAIADTHGDIVNEHKDDGRRRG